VRTSIRGFILCAVRTWLSTLAIVTIAPQKQRAAPLLDV
jgi:hypothetical protein